jgi:hypothetical protein
LAYKFFGPFLIAYLIILRYIQSFMCHSWSKPFQWMSRWPCCLGHWMTIRYLNVSSNVELLRYRRYCFLAGSCSVVRHFDLPESLATWEDYDSLHQRFPRAPA